MKTMRAFLSVLIVAFVSVVGCSRRTTLSSGSSGNEELITSFGEHAVIGGAFTVRVSERDGNLKVVRGRHFDMLSATNPATGQISITHNASITNTYSTEGWKAQPNWFVFAENDSRLWAYDGDRYLWLLTVIDAAGDSGSYGPRSFPCPVPDQVRSRLSVAARDQIENHAK
jgi:hypothetical protein